MDLSVCQVVERAVVDVQASGFLALISLSTSQTWGEGSPATYKRINSHNGDVCINFALSPLPLSLPYAFAAKQLPLGPFR